jgi:hypothetical protein
MVRHIHRLFDAGEDGSGPLTFDQIARRWWQKGYQWTPDLIEKRAIQRNEATRDLIYDWQVKKV